MDLINQFIDNYKKKFNYYESVGRLAAGQLEAVLRSSGIRAMVTYRAKNPGRLKSKVLRRNAKRPVQAEAGDNRFLAPHIIPLSPKSL